MMSKVCNLRVVIGGLEESQGEHRHEYGTHRLRVMVITISLSLYTPLLPPGPISFYSYLYIELDYT